MLNKIREGDIVVADIVGRRMTVDEVTESSAHCCWLDDNDNVYDAWFLLGALEVVE